MPKALQKVKSIFKHQLILARTASIQLKNLVQFLILIPGNSKLQRFKIQITLYAGSHRHSLEIKKMIEQVEKKLDVVGVKLIGETFPGNTCDMFRNFLVSYFISFNK